MSTVAGSVAEVVAGLEMLDIDALSRDDVRAAYAQTRLVRGWCAAGSTPTKPASRAA